MASEALDILIGALGSSNPIVQADAARLLGELKSSPAVSPLVDYVTNTRYHYKTAGFEALAKIGDRNAVSAIQPLVDRPNVPDDWFWFFYRAVRASAAVALLYLNDNSGVPYLESLAGKSDNVFFAWYAPAILRLPDELDIIQHLKARFTLETLTKHENGRTRLTDPAVVVMVTEALGICSGEEACNKLLDLMKFHSRYVRGQAVVSLLSSAPTEEHMRAAVQLAVNDTTDFVRIKAALALALAGDNQYVSIIENAARSLVDSFDRAVAVEALGILGHIEHERIVERGLLHSDAYIRQVSIEALDRIGGEMAFKAVERLRKDENIRVRLQAAKFFASREERTDR